MKFCPAGSELTEKLAVQSNVKLKNRKLDFLTSSYRRNLTGQMQQNAPYTDTVKSDLTHIQFCRHSTS